MSSFANGPSSGEMKVKGFLSSEFGRRLCTEMPAHALPIAFAEIDMLGTAWRKNPRSGGDFTE
jgi:hypothetical protein